MKVRKVLYWICVMIYIAGVIVFAWLDLHRLKTDAESRQTIQTFESGRKETKLEVQSDTSEKEREVSDELYRKMKEYNARIFENGQSDLRDPWSMEQEVLDLESYGVTDGMIGVISIPRMGVQLPIYLGAREENMSRGAVLLGQTSFPIDGENINSVIAAHRGWKGSAMFRDIESMEIGDQVTVQNPWETLTYQVTDIKVIMPDDIGQVLIQKGKNMVTLVTCHPYTGNSRRYVVYCEKADAETAEGSESDTEKKAEQVRRQAQSEDQEQLKQDTFLRKAGYAVIAAMGILVIFSGGGRKRRAEMDDVDF